MGDNIMTQPRYKIGDVVLVEHISIRQGIVKDAYISLSNSEWEYVLLIKGVSYPYKESEIIKKL